MVEMFRLSVPSQPFQLGQVSRGACHALEKEVFENPDEFKELHPALAVLSDENMLEGPSASIHPGALKHYREVGLIEQVSRLIQVMEKPAPLPFTDCMDLTDEAEFQKNHT